MPHITESVLFLFLIQVLILLGLSRILGLLFARFGQPAITAEILVGVLLGPTLLGRAWPELYGTLFPDDATQHAMLQSVAWLGLLFFLLVSGLDTDFSSVWRQKKHAAIISFCDLIIPMIVPFIACIFLPEHYLANDQRYIFALFVATILTISALPVTARALQDLGIYKTDVGLLIMSALTINDIAGWVVFALILGSTTGEGFTLLHVITVILATFVFTGTALTLGRRLTHRMMKAMRLWGLPEPGAPLTFICLLGLLSGAITLKIGIHALFGFFIAGIMAGNSHALSENTRHVIREMVRAVLVPLFFASIGLHIDFIAGFDPFIVVFLLVIGIAGRYAGAWVGAVLSKQPKEHHSLISIAHVPGGEMQIVVGILALEYRVITESVFVAILFGAIFSSMMLAPVMKWALNRREPDNILRYFSLNAIASRLTVKTRMEAIQELGRLAATCARGVTEEDIISQVVSREQLMGTALENGIAVPHARLKGLEEPVVVVGRSATGIDWNSIDGKPTDLIFLILTPTGESDHQIKILRSIAISMRNQTNRDALRDADGSGGVWNVLSSTITEPV